MRAWSLLCLILLLAPAPVLAEASVVQDSCVVYTDGGTIFNRLHFTVVNFSLPAPLCGLIFIPEPQPPLEPCIMLECGSPPGWMCMLNAFGGADWFANAPGDCIDPGTAKTGFSFVLDPDFCCYVVQFLDATGAVMLEQEECFIRCEEPVSVDGSSWGRVKSMYR